MAQQVGYAAFLVLLQSVLIAMCIYSHGCSTLIPSSRLSPTRGTFQRSRLPLVVGILNLRGGLEREGPQVYVKTSDDEEDESSETPSSEMEEEGQDEDNDGEYNTDRSVWAVPPGAPLPPGVEKVDWGDEEEDVDIDDVLKEVIPTSSVNDRNPLACVCSASWSVSFNHVS
jgi:hypothetical protein